MKNLTIILGAVFMMLNLSLYAQTGGAVIANGAATADGSAMLDVQSTTQGMLVPRMTTAQRTAISSPATGLLVFDNTTDSFWFYNGSTWEDLSGVPSKIADADNDTKVQVEKTADDDLIHFDMAGTEFFRMDGARLEVLNSGQSVYIGEGAGAADDLSASLFNILIGYNAGHNNNSGYYNSGIGDKVLENNTTGRNNAANGAWALRANTTGDYNTAAGSESLTANTTGEKNSASGSYTLHENTEGIKNTAMGYETLEYNTIGIENTATGYWGLRHNTTGNYNAAIGSQALYVNTTGDFNTASGNLALNKNTTGLKNTASGYKALNSNVTGSNNTAIGADAGVLAGDLTNATAIGYNAGVGASNSLVLGGTGSDKVNVGIGTTSPKATLDISSTDNGILIPRMTTAQRTAISSPATGLLVFDNTTGSFWFYNESSWEDISVVANHITDADNDTKVQVEKNADEDIIHFDMAGTEFFTMNGPRLEVLNSGKSVFIGEGAGAADDLSTNNNVFVGYEAGKANTTGAYNTAYGQFALHVNTTGAENTATGAWSLRVNTTGSANTATGVEVLRLNTTGAHNTATGGYSLHANTTGNYNIATGYHALDANTTGNYNTAIGYYAQDNSVVYNNTTAIGYHSEATASNMIRLGNGDISSIGGYTNWSNLSDGRFKTNVQENVAGLDFILKLRPLTYRLDMDALARFNKAPDSSRLAESEQLKAAEVQIGFIAQEVEEAATELGFDFHGVDKPKNEDYIIACVMPSL